MTQARYFISKFKEGQLLLMAIVEAVSLIYIARHHYFYLLLLSVTSWIVLIFIIYINIFIINEIILISSPYITIIIIKVSPLQTLKFTFSYSLMITRLPCLETDKPRHTNDENILTFWLAVCLSVTYVPVVTKTLIRAINI